MVGRAHKDPRVASAFALPVTLAKSICHGHFIQSRNERRRDPVNAGQPESGVFHNAVANWPGLVAAIDSRIDECRSSTAVDQVLASLKTTSLSGDPATDAMAKRLLMSYRLRNETSHNLDPTNPAMAQHYDEYRLWLLQAIFTTFFWIRETDSAHL